MGDWYEIGVALGLGLAAGLLLAGILAGWRYGLLVSVAGALLIGVLGGRFLKSSQAGRSSAPGANAQGAKAGR